MATTHGNPDRQTTRQDDQGARSIATVPVAAGARLTAAERLKRRGMLATLAGLAAGAAASVSAPTSVQAANGDTLRAGMTFSETSPFSLTNTGLGRGATFTGSANNEGVAGIANGSNAWGVLGESDTGHAGHFHLTNPNSTNDFACYAHNVAGTDGGGVLGEGQGAGAGVKGQGGLNNGPGVLALGGATSGVGVDATGGPPGGWGIIARGGGNTGVGIYSQGATPTTANTSAGWGLIAGGGTGNGTGTGGAGGYFFGGNGGATAGTDGGVGVFAYGGYGGGPNTDGADGLNAQGGIGTGTGTHGVGVRAFGVGPTATASNAIRASSTSNANPTIFAQNAGSAQAIQGLNTAGVGVQGSSGTALGVYGNSGSGTGVWGDSDTNTGVTGRSNSGPGVQGQSTNNAGVYGTSVNSYGVYATTAAQPAVYAQATAGNTGVQGESNSGYGIYGHSVTGQAGHFDGAVVVNGAFTVVGGPKSAAVPFTDGSVRRLYATEAPESWFEDYGEARIVNGRASVPIPADFAQAVNTAAPYYVFTESNTAEIQALAVTVRAGDHFEVKANGEGQVSGVFSYRIVAKRKDVAAPRFERVTSLQLQTPVPADAATRPAVALPKPPDVPASIREIPATAADQAPARPKLPEVPPAPAPTLVPDKR
jgi:hypothetical protein